jgi:hypothetical protein
MRDVVSICALSGATYRGWESKLRNNVPIMFQSYSYDNMFSDSQEALCKDIA